MTRIARVAPRAQRELDIIKIEMVKSASVATATQKLLDIASGDTRSLNKVISGLQQRLDALEARGSVGSDHPPLESGSSRQTPRPRRSPQESPQRQCPLSHHPPSPQRGPPQQARAAWQWQ